MAIWMDITTSYKWSHKSNKAATGTVRVELEVVRGMLAYTDTERFHFFRYNKDTDEFVVLPEPDVRRILDTITYWPENVDKVQENTSRIPPLPKNRDTCFKRKLVQTRQQQSAFISFKHIVKMLLIRTFFFFSSFFPARYQPRLLEVSRKTAAPVRRMMRFGAGENNVPAENQKSRKHQEREEPAKKIPFMDGDAILCLGAIWNNAEMNSRFVSLHKEIPLQIYSISHDLIPILHPHLHHENFCTLYTNIYYDISTYSSHVFCVSRHTMRDYSRFLAEASMKNVSKSIITLGCDITEASETETEIDRFIQTTGAFILYVSKIERRKNHALLYNIICSWVDEGVTDFPAFVFVGRYHLWGVNYLKDLMERDVRLKNKIYILQSVSDTALARLYKQSLFTVYPSLYEGWGLPITESLAYGKFCISSNTSSMPEAGFGFTEQISPFDTKKWSERILYFYNNRHELLAREKAIRENFRKPEWKQTAAEILHVVKKKQLDTCNQK